MDARHELLMRLKKIIHEQLSVEEERISLESTWAELGADSLDRLDLSLALEAAFKVDIPHSIGERLHTVGETTEHLLTLMASRRDVSNIRIESATTNGQWAEMSAVRTQVFGVEHGLSFGPLPGPGDKRAWHFLARDGQDAIGALSVLDTTGDSQVHQRYGLTFGEHERVARYAQLAILKPYRKRGIFKMLLDTAQRTVIRPNGFVFGWLLYPAGRVRSSELTQGLGFTASNPLLTTEFGPCR